DAVFLEARPGLYRERFERMLDALDLVSPLVEGAELGCASVGLDGLGGIFGDEPAIAKAMIDGVRNAIGLRPRVGVAETRFAAWAAALETRGGEGRILEPGDA